MCVKFGDWKRCGFWDFREQRPVRKRRNNNNNNNNKKDSTEIRKIIKDSEEFGILESFNKDSTESRKTIKDSDVIGIF